jgi:hypothetical protein
MTLTANQSNASVQMTAAFDHVRDSAHVKCGRLPDPSYDTETIETAAVTA